MRGSASASVGRRAYDETQNLEACSHRVLGCEFKERDGTQGLGEYAFLCLEHARVVVQAATRDSDGNDDNLFFPIVIFVII